MESIVLPELGEGIEKATVACLDCQVGDLVQADEDLIEMVTDKATFNVSASQSGKVKEILVKEGQEVEIGKTLILIETGHAI